MKRIFVIIYFAFLCVRSMGQISIDTCTCVFFDEFINTYSYISSYKITNNTKEDYITWVSCKCTNYITNEEAIRCYFENRIEDYSLSFLLYENLLNSSMTNRIGTSFMKRIKPQESFEYLIQKKNSSPCYFENHIFVISLKEIEKYLHKGIPEECFSTINALPLYENHITHVN